MTKAVYILARLWSDFVYTPDRGDTWSIPKGDIVRGDCEDFALGLAYRLANRSLMRMWFEILTFRSVVWFGETHQGVKHVALWRRGEGWACNMYPEWGPKRHKMWLPMWAPFLALKILLGKL